MVTLPCQPQCQNLFCLRGNDLWHGDWYNLLTSIILAFIFICRTKYVAVQQMSWLICPVCSGRTSVMTFPCVLVRPLSQKICTIRFSHVFLSDMTLFFTGLTWLQKTCFWEAAPAWSINKSTRDSRRAVLPKSMYHRKHPQKQSNLHPHKSQYAN